MSRYEALGNAIESAVRKACEGKEVGIAFSGGMDSGLVAALAKKYARSVTCYTCGTDDSFDVAAGRELAEKLGLPWVHCRISEESIANDIRERTAGEPIILTGQGSDEYFGGCARTVDEDEAEYRAVMEWGVERLMKVSVPCELAIASNFRKRLFYPYLDGEVVRQVGLVDPDEIRPRSLEDRKMVLKTVAEELGFPILAHRTKKASQYGSNTTELIRDAARAKGVRYNRFIAGIYESLGLRDANLLRDAAVDVRMDPILLYDAEQVLGKLGMTHSEAVAEFYRKLVKEGNLDFLK